jgi:hypothetical protein
MADQQPRASGSTPLPSEGADFGGSLGAGGRGFFDGLTLGLDKPVGAAMSAAEDALTRGQNWFDSYKDHRANLAAQDQYDEAHHAMARHAGQAIGTIVGIGVTDGMSAGPEVSARIAPLAPKMVDPTVKSLVRVLRPWGAAAFAGAGVSVGTQGVSDAASGHLSDLPTYIASAAGGAAGGIGTLARSPAIGASADAAVSEATHSALTGQPLRLSQMENNALMGGYAGLLGHIMGTNWSNSLSPKQKGELGENMAEAYSDILGDKHLGSQQKVQLSEGYTRADHVTDNGPVEAKFGYSADLSKRQRQARSELSNYTIDHFLPPDVGRITGGLLALANSPAKTHGAP